MHSPRHTSFLKTAQRRFIGVGFAMSIGLAILAFRWPTVVTDPLPPRHDRPIDGEVIDQVLVVRTEVADPSPPVMEPVSRPTAPLPDLPDVEPVPDDVRVPDLDLPDLDTDVADPDLPTAPTASGPEPPRTVVSTMPRLPACADIEDEDKAFACVNERIMDHIRRHMAIPDALVREGVEGTMHVQFIIEPDGRMSSIRSVTSLHPALDHEAERVLGMLDGWVPGKQQDVPVRVLYTIPIRIALD